MRHLLCILFSLSTLVSFGQNGVIKGKIVNKVSNEVIPFGSVIIQGTTIGAAANESGEYEIKNLQPGLYNLQASFVGFKPLIVFEVQVTNSRIALVDFALEEEAQKLEEVVISATNSFFKSDESPLSLRTIGTAEIKRTPGGNRDISKVVRSLPGVASTPSFRNDIIIRNNDGPYIQVMRRHRGYHKTARIGKNHRAVTA